MQRIARFVLLQLIHWIAIYPGGSVIQSTNIYYEMPAE